MKYLKIIIAFLIIIVLIGCIFLITRRDKKTTDSVNSIKSNSFSLWYEGDYIRPGLDGYEYLEAGFYYKKIYDYNEYLNYKEKFNQILEVTEDEFKENFIIIILVEKEYLLNLSVDNYYNIDDKLQIDLYTNESIDTEKTNGNAILIKREMDREKVNIEKIVKGMEMQPYTNLKELPPDYSKEQAITDNCLVTSLDEMKTYNKEVLDTFISNVNNNISSSIRVCRSVNNSIAYILDIEYVQGEKFNIYERSTVNEELIYEGNTIKNTEIKTTEENTSGITQYSIMDDINRFDITVYN